MKVELEPSDFLELCTPNARGESFAQAIIDEEYIGFRPGNGCVLTFTVGVTAKKILFNLMADAPSGNTHWIRLNDELVKALSQIPGTLRSARSKTSGERTNPKMQVPLQWPEKPGKG